MSARECVAAVVDKGKSTCVAESVAPSRSCLQAAMSCWVYLAGLFDPRDFCSTTEGQPAHAAEHLAAGCALAVGCAVVPCSALLQELLWFWFSLNFDASIVQQAVLPEMNMKHQVALSKIS